MLLPNREEWIKKYIKYIQRVFHRVATKEEAVKEYYKHFRDSEP